MAFLKQTNSRFSQNRSDASSRCRATRQRKQTYFASDATKKKTVLENIKQIFNLYYYALSYFNQYFRS